MLLLGSDTYFLEQIAHVSHVIPCIATYFPEVGARLSLEVAIKIKIEIKKL